MSPLLSVPSPPSAAPAARTTPWPPATAWSARSPSARPAWKPTRGSNTPRTTRSGPQVRPCHRVVTVLSPRCHRVVTAPSLRPLRQRPRGRRVPGVHLEVPPRWPSLPHGDIFPPLGGCRGGAGDVTVTSLRGFPPPPSPRRQRQGEGGGARRVLLHAQARAAGALLQHVRHAHLPRLPAQRAQGPPVSGRRR